MSRRHRVPPPPSNLTGNTLAWAWAVTDALNLLPPFSIVSGNPNTSGISADQATLAFNVASGGSVLYVNASGTTNSWRTISY